MAVDPELQARVASITGADPSHAPTPEERATLTASAFAAVGLDTPAVMHAPVAMYAVDMTGRVAAWNRAAEELFGYTAAEAIGEPPLFLPDDEVDDSLAGLERLFEGETLSGIEYAPRHKDGNRLHVLTSASLLRDEAGEPTAILAFAVDQTAKRVAGLALEQAHHKWRQLLMNVSDTVTILDEHGRVKESTGEFTDVLGYDPDGWTGNNGFELIHPDDLVAAGAVWAELVADPEGERRDVFRVRHEDGHYEWIEFTGVNLLHDPVIAGVVMTTRNVTVERQAEALLTDEASVLELIARNAPLTETLAAAARLVEVHGTGATAIMLLDATATALEVGAPGSVPPALLELVGHAPLPEEPQFAELRRPVVIADYATDHRTRTFAAEAAALGVRAGWAVPIVDNRSSELLGIIATYYDESREPTAHELDVGGVASHLAAIAIDRDRWQRELSHQARHHHLTDLPNRDLIIENLDAARARAERDDTTVSVMFVDLDRFKVVNDSLGHAAGDELLVRFGGRLSTIVRPGDFVGHFGGDVFVVILEDTHGDDDARFVANRLDLALSEPFSLGGSAIFLSASIGVATSPAGRDSSEALLQHADAAMFHAKDLGRDRMETFDTEMRTRVTERLRIDRELRMAIEHDELTVHYQPQLDLASGRIVGAEALLRWEHPDQGLVYPESFLGVAEDTGLIVPIGRMVLDHAVAQGRAWADALPDPTDFMVAVNMSARQISAPGLVESIRRVLERHGWPARQLVLELTESILIDDRDATLDILTDLKSLGVRLAIDDFGTGFSSLNYLHRFPVDIVKIDRSFVHNLGADGEGSPVATAILHMAHVLDLTTAAEGVEAAHQRDGLRVLACDLAQGHLFTEARPAAEITPLITGDHRW